MKLIEAEAAAKEANINAVAAFIRENGKDYDRVSIQILKETLMAAYLEETNGREMDPHIFSNIKRIANL